jgi:hypothetical protein
MVNINKIIDLLDFKNNLACTACKEGFYTLVEDIINPSAVQVTCTMDCPSVDF